MGGEVKILFDKVDVLFNEVICELLKFNNMEDIFQGEEKNVEKVS